VPIRFGIPGLDGRGSRGLIRDGATGGGKVLDVGDAPTRSRPTTSWCTTPTAPTDHGPRDLPGSPTLDASTRHRSASSAKSPDRRTTTKPRPNRLGTRDRRGIKARTTHHADRRRERLGPGPA
jgi:hypothetical protein